MGRIFISAGHGGLEFSGSDLGAITGGTTAAQEMMLLRDQVVQELRSRGFQVLSIPDELSLGDTLGWINSRAQPGDVALELHANVSSNPNSRGATAYFPDKNKPQRTSQEGKDNGKRNASPKCFKETNHVSIPLRLDALKSEAP